MVIQGFRLEFFRVNGDVTPNVLLKGVRERANGVRVHVTENSEALVDKLLINLTE